MKLEGLTINFLGDSITEGVGASSKENIFHACRGSHRCHVPVVDRTSRSLNRGRTGLIADGKLLILIMLKDHQIRKSTADHSKKQHTKRHCPQQSSAQIRFRNGRSFVLFSAFSSLIYHSSLLSAEIRTAKIKPKHGRQSRSPPMLVY